MEGRGWSGGVVLLIFFLGGKCGGEGGGVCVWWVELSSSGSEILQEATFFEVRARASSNPK